MENIIIIGSGPAGLTAGIYLARADFKPLILAGLNYGGQLMTTTEVENFPGFPEGIKGPELIQRMIKQAEKFGARVVYEDVSKVNFVHRPFTISTDNQTVESKSVIVATGAYPRKLGLESEKTFWGRGISSCATCDGAFYRNKIVAVVGGGDSSMEEAIFLTKFASKVYIIHRRNAFRASKIMAKRVLEHPKIEVIWNSIVADIIGDKVLTAVKLQDTVNNETRELNTDGLFLAIGYNPATDLFKDQLEMDEKGYLITKDNSSSSIEGVFIAGDVEDYRYKQAVTAAAEGCKAALDAEKYMEGLK